MKILYITGLSPWPPSYGGAMRDYNFLKQLSKNHDVKAVILSDSPQSFDSDLNIDVEFYSRVKLPSHVPDKTIRGRIKILLSCIFSPPRLAKDHSTASIKKIFAVLHTEAKSSDIVWVSRPYFAYHAIKLKFGSRIIVDYVDIEWVAQSSQKKNLRFGIWWLFEKIDTFKLRRFERKVASQSWRNVVCKAEDARLLGSIQTRTHVVPNGTNVHKPCEPEKENPGSLLFVGLMSYAPNIDAVSWFAREILPVVRQSEPLANLCVVGKDPPETIRLLESADSGVEVKGFAPELRSFYERASVVVCPIRTGSGTKLKVLEALSYGKAMVATTEAIAGTDLRPGIDCLVADSPAEFASAILRLFSNPDLRKSLGLAGREAVIQRFSWDVVGEHLDAVIRQ